MTLSCTFFFVFFVSLENLQNMTTLTFFLLPLVVVGDMCQDYCVERLGPGPCSKGTYCKRDYDCHNLFWTNGSKAEICFLSRDGACSNRFPVLCAEAAGTRVSSIRRGNVATTTAYPSTAPRTVVIESPVSLVGDLMRIITSGIVSLRRAFVQPPTIGPVQVAQVRDNVGAFELHFRGNPFDIQNRPYVKLSFEDDDRNLGFFAMFDTGSGISTVMIESRDHTISNEYIASEPWFHWLDETEPVVRPACAGEGYRLRPGIIPQNPETLTFGVSGFLDYQTSLGTIPGNMTLFSRVSQFKFHDPAFHLIVSPHPFSRVLLGASRSSAFATAARVFAVIPDVERLANGNS